jgi:hypothetical protein
MGGALAMNIEYVMEGTASAVPRQSGSSALHEAINIDVATPEPGYTKPELEAPATHFAY